MLGPVRWNFGPEVEELPAGLGGGASPAMGLLEASAVCSQELAPMGWSELWPKVVEGILTWHRG